MRLDRVKRIYENLTNKKGEDHLAFFINHVISSYLTNIIFLAFTSPLKEI